MLSHTERKKEKKIGGHVSGKKKLTVSRESMAFIQKTRGCFMCVKGDRHFVRTILTECEE